MPKTTKSDVIIPEIFDQALEGAFDDQNALLGSAFAAINAAVVVQDLEADRSNIGDPVKVPYFGHLGDFTDMVDGDAVPTSKLAQAVEQATVKHSGIAVELTRMANQKNIYEELSRQMVVSALRKGDAAMVAECFAAGGGATVDVYSALAPKILDYDTIVDAKMTWGDEQDEDSFAGLVLGTKQYSDLCRLKDGHGKLLMRQVHENGKLSRFLGFAVSVSDALPREATLSAPLASGTTPPALALSVPVAIARRLTVFALTLRVKITVGGARGTAKFRFSLNEGQTWSPELTTGASVPLFDATYPELDNVAGNTGIVAEWPIGTYATDNEYLSQASIKFASLLLKKNALAFWFSRRALAAQVDRDILVDSDVLASHLYYAAHRYRRYRTGSRSGVCRIYSN